MENASKALIMAAGVLIALVIIGAFMLMMSNLTDYQNKSYLSKADAQTTEFNNQYTGYIRDGIRGSDMISLMNKILDYNTRKTDDGYTEMQIEIDMNGHANDLLFDRNKGNKLIKQSTYNQNEISLITNAVQPIEYEYKQKYAGKLADEISNIQDLVKGNGYTSDPEQEFVDMKILPVNTKEELQKKYGSLDEIYADALVYYEYVQFKRAVFNCTDSKFDPNTGRILSMEFECTGVGV